MLNWEVTDFTLSATINAAACVEILKGLKEAIQQKKSGLLTKRVLLFHNNAQPHSATTTVNLLNSWGWDILPNPPYNPDMAPSMKKHLRGQHFHPNENVKKKSSYGYVLGLISFMKNNFINLKILTVYSLYMQKQSYM
jgi:hypothetical protein